VTAPTGLPKNPKVTNYCFVTFASVFGDDPSSAVRAMIASLKGPARAGPAASSVARRDRRRRHGDQRGARLDEGSRSRRSS
jgi:hypothetical protein